MTLFPESAELPAGRAVLLSIKPRYADLILAGTKKVELRRSWPVNDIGVMVLYSSAPIQKLVGVAYIDRVNEATVSGLWKLAHDNGGGLAHDELVQYFDGKKLGYGIMIKGVKSAECAIDPKVLFPDFVPPQSFQYLTPGDFQLVMNTIFSRN